MNGHLSSDQAMLLAPFVERAVVVYDLGAMGGYLSRWMLDLGARFVVAVDKDPICPVSLNGRIEWHRATFREYLQRAPARIPLALVSWPVPHAPTPGLAELCARAEVVAYLGKNTGGLACGSPELFAHLTRRPVLAHARDPHNDLIIYGAGEVVRALLPEELAATAPLSAFLTWENAAAAARELGWTP